MWIIVGEWPGVLEARWGRPFCGPTGEVVDKMLHRIGRPRNRIGTTNTVLCLPCEGADDKTKERAAEACKTRLQLELAQYPGKPILSLGTMAAKSLIPREVLDAIDPPESKSKRSQKKDKLAEEEQARKKERKEQALLERRHAMFLAKETRALIKAATDRIAQDARRRGMRPSKHGLKMAIEPLLATLNKRAAGNAQRIFDDWKATRDAKRAAAKRAKPKKSIKITDIASTLFKVDVDHSGPRALIPMINPAAILRGGGRTLAGTHTPDLAFINLVFDAAKVDAIAQGKDIELVFPGDNETLDSARASRLIWQIYVEALEEGRIGIDLETYVDDQDRHHALQAYIAKIRAVGLATSKRWVSVLWDLLQPWAVNLLGFLLLSTAVTKIYHNAIYDRTVLAARGLPSCGASGVWSTPFDDSLLRHHAAFPGCAHNLQSVTAQFYGVTAWKSEFRNAEETPEALTVYNGKDTFSTVKVNETLTVWTRRTATEKVYENDRKKSEIFSKMHLAGVPIDRDANEELLKQFSASVAERRRVVEEVANDPKIREQVWHFLAHQQALKKRKKDDHDFEHRYDSRLAEIRTDHAKGDWYWKIAAPKHIAALLEALGVKLTKYTSKGQEGGQLSTDKEVLEALVHVPVVRDILTYREDDKLLMTFVWPAFDRRDRAGNVISYGYADQDDRVHPIWSIHKITGRVASSEMSFGNVPKELRKKQSDGSMKVVRPNLRKQVVAPKGRVFVGFDFSALEGRIVAILSKDPWLVDIFTARDQLGALKDFHDECAKIIFDGGDPRTPDYIKLGAGDYFRDPVNGEWRRSKIQKQLRDNTKQFDYGAIYGGSPETLWKTALKKGYELDLNMVVKAVQKLLTQMSLVVEWQRDCVRRASTPPYQIVERLLGRRRTFPLGQVDPNEAINFGVQACGASIMDEGMIRMHERLPKYRDAFEILQIHDAAVYETDEDDAERVRCDIKECYETEIDGVPFPIDARISNTWAGI